MTHPRVTPGLNVAACLLAAACSLPEPQPSPSTSAQESPPPEGASCIATVDCAPGDICMEQRCRRPRASAAGEVLAEIAAGHARQAEHVAATQSYSAAIDAFRKAELPVPASLYCALADVSLQGATTREARELAARHADQCFRESPPGLAERATVIKRLAELRVEGLQPAHFDEPQPAAAFFTAEATKPRADSVEIDFDMPTRTSPAYADITALLRAATGRDAVTACFIADWQERRGNRAETTVVLSFTSRMRDMGDYDAYVSSLEIEAADKAASDDFTTCIVRSLQTALTTLPKINRVVAWRENVHIVAHL